MRLPVREVSPMNSFAFLVAVAGALLINAPLPPNVNEANQLISVLGWGLVLLLVPTPSLAKRGLRAVAPLVVAITLVAMGCAVSLLGGALPTSLGIATLGILAMAALIALHGASMGARDPATFFRPFAVAVVAGGLGGALIGILQCFAPGILDNQIVALSHFPGRAAGNIGQPNQLSDTLLWALVALVPLVHAKDGQPPRSRAALAGFATMALLLLFALVLSGSRTGLVGIAVVAAWGWLDRQLSRSTRVALMASPVAVALLWAALGATWHLPEGADPIFTHHADLTNYRSDIWHQALVLIAQQPWTGVGWGQFNFASTLTSFARPPFGFADNAHNLPLQLAVELGVPAALVIVGLLLFAAWFAYRRVRRLPGMAGTSCRCAMMMVVLVGLHSMLEFPLWNAYILFPAAWAWGLSLGAAGGRDSAVAATSVAPAPPLRAWRVLGLLMVVVAASAWIDYLNIVALYQPQAGALPLDERIRHAQASPLFSAQADYVAAIEARSPAKALPEIQRSAHVQFDGRLLYLWANILAEQGEIDKARYVAARLREFDLSGPRPFFAACSDPAVVAKPFQCLPPATNLTWRDFR